ncbi:MAG: PDZ domain-containing protein [Chitinophagales bacterium]
MRNYLLLWICTLLCPFVLSAQFESNTIIPTSHYEIAFPNALHHEAEISITYRHLPDEPFIVTMSSTSPGRYAIHQFGKNVYNVAALDEAGQALEIERITPESWQILKHNGTVNVHYTLFADRADGTYAKIDDTHAHLNIPATFMWAKGLEKYPITVEFHIPENSKWKIATQLKSTATPSIFLAPNLQYFMDSPTKLSDYSLREWSVQNPDGNKLVMRLAVTHDTEETVIDDFAEIVKRVVLEQQAIYGELPSYDFGNYTFICDYRTGINGDGMEHRNSTMLTSSNSLANNIVPLMGTVSHEFFHCWNVERLRPASLEPFDFEHANMCGELWFAEGFTSYYDDLILCRVGVHTLDDYAAKLSTDLQYVLNQPATGLYSAIDMSQRAPFVDAASQMDKTNFQNCHTSYYPLGSVIGLALDLQLRSSFDNVNLDDYMYALWQSYGKEEIPFTIQDLETTLAEVTGDKNFADTFFKEYIYGTAINDYKALLANAGLLLQKKYPNRAYLSRCQYSFQKDKGLQINSGTVKGTPLYNAGLDVGDVITAIDGKILKNSQSLQDILKTHAVGDEVEITYLHHGNSQKTVATLSEDYRLEVITYEDAGLKVDKKIKQFREDWLSSKVVKAKKGLILMNDSY